MVQQATYERHAILVADMVGYSRWLAHQPVATHSGFMAHLRDVFQPAVRVHAGQVVKTTGEGIVAIFKKTGDAESCARDIQARLREREAATTPDVALEYRIAVHYGNIMVLPDDVFGLDVNAAIHMQGLAPPDGICISGDLFFRLNEHSRTPYAYAGRRYVKTSQTRWMSMYTSSSQERRARAQGSHGLPRSAAGCSALLRDSGSPTCTRMRNTNGSAWWSPSRRRRCWKVFRAFAISSRFRPLALRSLQAPAKSASCASTCRSSWHSTVWCMDHALSQSMPLPSSCTLSI